MRIQLLLIVSIFLMTSYKHEPTHLNKSKLLVPINSYVADVVKDFRKIPRERKKSLKKLTEFIEGKIKVNDTAKLTFICTHNSRRSHMSQIWAQAAAEYYGVESVEAYSGGTEATAFNPRAIKALQNAGFEITKTSDGSNPLYNVKYANEKSIIGFSKTYDHDENPQNDFCAVMTCSHADLVCPIIPTASARVIIPYEDPKEFDGRPEEATEYDKRCRQIATEIFYAFSLVKK